MHTCRQPAFIQGSPVLHNRSLEIQTCIVDLINPSVFLFSSFQIELTILLLHLTAHPLTVRRLASRWVGWCSGSGGSTARRSSASSLAHHPPIPPSLPISHNLTVLSFLTLRNTSFTFGFCHRLSFMLAPSSACQRHPTPLSQPPAFGCLLPGIPDCSRVGSFAFIPFRSNN